jgi:ankyrin repeat protein
MGNKNAIELLLDNGANVNKKDKLGNTFLHCKLLKIKVFYTLKK